MRILMGIKDFTSARTIVSTLGPLGWPNAEIRVVHVLEAPGGLVGKMLLTASEGDYIAQYLHTQRYIGNTLCESVCKELNQLGYKADYEVLEGSPAERLHEASTAFAADLIALYLPHQSAWDAWFSARVARRLLLDANTSLLICRPEVEGAPVTHAVFASDHSPYADRCALRLLALAPRGLSAITVMTAYQRDLVSSLGPFVGQLGLDVSTWVREKLQTENSQVLSQFEAAGYACRSEVREATVHEAIEASLAENKAGLLILGAQGHGFVERLTMGSVSLHETLYSRVPLLVLRT